MVLGGLGRDGGEDEYAVLLVERIDDDKTLRPGEGLQAQCGDGWKFLALKQILMGQDRVRRLG